MGVVSTYVRKQEAEKTVRAEESANYSMAKNQDCKQLLLDIKDIEIRISALPNKILLASTSNSLTSTGTATMQQNLSRTVATFSPKMKAEYQLIVLKEILAQKQTQANSMLCYEEAKAQETTKKNVELSDMIVDSNIKAEEQIIPETEKKTDKTLLIGGAILLVALGLILVFSSKKK